MIRRLIVPLTAAVVSLHAGQVVAQTPFPAPLPNQSASPFPPVNGVAAAPKFLISLQASSGGALRSLAALIILPRRSASSRKGTKPFMQASAEPLAWGGPPDGAIPPAGMAPRSKTEPPEAGAAL